MARPSSARGRSGRDRLESLALSAALRAVGRLPDTAADSAGRLLGHVAYALLRRRRRVALDNLARVWANRSPAERARIARASFVSLGHLVVEFARLPTLTAEAVHRRISWEGWEHYQEAAAAGRGVLYLAAHFGAWELLPYAQAVVGYPMAFIVRPADNPAVEALVRGYREGAGNSTIPKRTALRAALRRLRAGETVGILIDQHVPADGGVPTELLGQPVFTTTALAALALRSGAPVLPAFVFREQGGRQRIRLGPEVQLVRTGVHDRDLVENTRRFVAVVEAEIVAHPEQWLWAHRRFRGRG